MSKRLSNVGELRFIDNKHTAFSWTSLFRDSCVASFVENVILRHHEPMIVLGHAFHKHNNHFDEHRSYVLTPRGCGWVYSVYVSDELDQDMTQ